MTDASRVAPLWEWNELVAASGGVADGVPATAITGFSLDSRAVGAGDVFVALKDQRDGHEFVSTAFATGAVAALVCREYVKKAGDGPLLRVVDPLKGLESIGAAARARLSPSAKVIAVTGSAGKTGTKEMLRACLSRIGRTHAPEKSFNNHWGVPLTLARMPASSQFGVFEIGMNHAGEITPLTKLVRPHVAVVTNVLAVHLGHFADEEGIARAKAEIFLGIEPGGVAVLNRDSPHYDLLAKLRLENRGSDSLARSFGRRADATIRLEQVELGVEHSNVRILISGPRGPRNHEYQIGAPGDHYVINSLAVAAALDAVGVDLHEALIALAEFKAPAGRGRREEIVGLSGKVLLIDEAYNANPASMRAALATLALVPRSAYPRRVAVLGDMLELGERSVELHAGLNEAVDAAGIDLVFAAGPHMQSLFDLIGEDRRGAWAQTSEGLTAALTASVTGGDAIVIKGSLGSNMGPLVDALRLSLTKTGPHPNWASPELTTRSTSRTHSGL